MNPLFQQVVQEHKAHLMQQNAQLLTLQYKQKAWRVIAIYQKSASQRLVIVGEPMVARHAAVWEIVETLGFPVVVGLPLMLLLMSMVIRVGFKQLTQFSQDLTCQSPENIIEKRIDVDCPAELRPLVMEIQHLLVRIQSKTDLEKQFIANAAHELKTPIAALKLQVGLLENVQDSDAQKSEAIKGIKQTIHRTEKLIAQLLSLQKLQMSVVDFERVSLNEVLSVVHQVLSPLLEDKQQQISYQLPKEAICVQANAFWAQQLFINLISNAIAYSPEQGHILVSVIDEEGRVYVEFEDEGDGLTTQEIERVTERFYRLDKHKGQPSGSGLGLSIVQEICQKYQIDFQMERSERLGGLKVSLFFETLHQRESR